MRLFEQSGTWRPEDRAEGQLVSLSVEVPAGLEALRVELDYDRANAAVLDLGCDGPEGWVGWSGGARRHYLVSEQWSTPGYLPVPLVPGEWKVVLGLHRVPEAGVGFRVRVEAVSASDVAAEAQAQPPAPPPPPRPPRRQLPTFDGMRWRAGDFHAHTLHSDGALSVEQLAALGVARGLEVLAVTDHNTTSHHAELAAAGARYGIQLVPGQEVTTDRGHANAYGDIGFVDFRQPASQWQRDVGRRGGLLSVNHPLGGDCAWRMPLEEPTTVAEVWHSSWLPRPTWGGPLAWWLSWGVGTVPVGGSDFHRLEDGDVLGAPTTWVLCEDDDVLGAVAAGRTSIGSDPQGPVLLREGDSVTAIGADGALLTGFDHRRRRVLGDRVTLAVEPGPAWLEDDHMGILALTG